MPSIAVTGAAGRLGRQVTALIAESHEHVVALTRRPLAPARGISVRVAPYEDRPTLRAALTDVDTLVLVSSDGPSEKVVHHHLNLIDAAVAAEVDHLIVLSSEDADLESPFCYAVVNALTEKAARETGLGLTIARASLFSEFFLLLVNGATVQGELRLPAADGRIGLVSRTDVGRCLAAYARKIPTGAVHHLTGPASLDMNEVAAALGVRHVPISESEYVGKLAGREQPWWIYAYASMFASIREQRWARVSNEVEQVIGDAAEGFGRVLERMRKLSPEPPWSARR